MKIAGDFRANKANPVRDRFEVAHAMENRLLAKKPEDRFQSATELLDQLADIAVPTGAGASAGAPTRRTVIALTTVVAVVMTLLVVQRGRNRAAITAAPSLVVMALCMGCCPPEES